MVQAKLDFMGGQITEEGVLIDNHKEGVWQEIITNGFEQGVYRRGQKIGIWRTFVNDVIIRERNYTLGLEKVWDPQGTTIGSYRYQQDHLIRRIEPQFEDIIIIMKMVHGLRSCGIMKPMFMRREIVIHKGIVVENGLMLGLVNSIQKIWSTKL